MTKKAFFKRPRQIFNRFISGFAKHDLTTLAAALAFYTALSLAPLLLLLIAIVGLLGPSGEQNLMTQIDYLMGDQAAEAVKMIVQNTAQKPVSGSIAGVIGILTLLFSASAVFSQLRSSLAIIWETPADENENGFLSYARAKLFSMGIVLAFVFLALVSLGASTVLAAILPTDATFWSAINTLISIAVFAYLFALVFKYLPDARVKWRHVLWGGLFTSILFTLGKSLIGTYLGRSAVGSAYGAAGSLIVFLTWVYYSSIIVFMGAEFTKATFANEKDARTQ